MSAVDGMKMAEQGAKMTRGDLAKGNCCHLSFFQFCGEIVVMVGFW
jgi:hypothetical protein